MNFTMNRVITRELVHEVHTRMVTLIDSVELSRSLQLDPEDFNRKMNIAVEESLQTLRILVGLELPVGARVLEVGAGYGLASICLAIMGFDVTALEPGGTGFEENRQVSSVVVTRAGVQISHIDESAESFDFAGVPPFALVVSNNVLEHIPDVEAALTNLSRAIDKDGIMVHSCANYTFPFEPHFGIPLVPFVPRLTGLLIPRRIRNDSVWKSLNFVNAGQVHSNARRNGLVCRFRRGTMTSSISRLTSDEQFARRHAALARLVRNRAVRGLAMRALSLPVRLATPMDFLVCFEARAHDKTVNSWLKNS